VNVASPPAPDAAEPDEVVVPEVVQEAAEPNQADEEPEKAVQKVVEGAVKTVVPDPVIANQ